MLSVTISRQAWNAEPIGADPAYKADTPGMQRLKDSAVVRRRGFGYQVVLCAEPDDLLRLADWFEADGEVWLDQCDSPSARKEAKACLRAAEAIRLAVSNSR